MDTVRTTKRVCLMLFLCLVSAVTARATNLCATDGDNNTILLRTDTDFPPPASAVVGLHGSLTLAADGTRIPLYGTALVNAKPDGMLIAVQGLQVVVPQPPLDPLHAGKHIGILINTDLSLNGTGSFETFTSTGSSGPTQGIRFLFDSNPVTWTAATCS